MTWRVEDHLERTDEKVAHLENGDVTNNVTYDKTDHVQVYTLAGGKRSMSVTDDMVQDKTYERVSPRVVPAEEGGFTAWKSTSLNHEDRHSVKIADIQRNERGARIAEAVSVIGHALGMLPGALLFDATGNIGDLLNDAFTTITVTTWTENRNLVQGSTETKVWHDGTDTTGGPTGTYTSSTLFNGTDRLTQTEAWNQFPGHWPESDSKVTNTPATGRSLASGMPSYVDPDGLAPIWSNVLDYIEDAKMAAWDLAGVLVANPGSALEYANLVVMEYLDGGAAVDAVAGWVDGLQHSLNPLDRWLSIPDIGPVYGFTNAYAAGRTAGMITGIAANIFIGNVAAGAYGFAQCGSLLLNAARVYTYVETAAGIAGAVQNIITTGTVSIGDVIALIPALTWGLRAMSGLRATCFIMGTGVLVEDPEKPGLFSKKVIEDVHDGDKVWTKREDDPDAPLELKVVTKTFRYTAYDLQTVSVEDQTGNVEVIHVTDAHPFYVEGLGWTGAADLLPGEHLVSSDGEILTVTANVDEPHLEGIAVFNFEVEGDHTYFVSDGIGDAVGDSDWVWVHNYCTPAQLAANRVNGLAAQDKLALQLEKLGYNVVAKGVFVRIGKIGKREIDIVVRIGKTLHGIEVKSGGAVRNAMQLLKDAFINKSGGVRFFGKRATASGLKPADLLMSIIEWTVP